VYNDRTHDARARSGWSTAPRKRALDHRLAPRLLPAAPSDNWTASQAGCACSPTQLHAVDIMEPGEDDPALASSFTVESQRLELDFRFSPRQLVEGKTTITIRPQSPKLREIPLACRQLKPTSVKLKGQYVPFSYNNLYDRLSLYPTASIHQYDLVRERISKSESGEKNELIIYVPDKMRIKEDKYSGTQETVCESLEVEIMYTLDDFRDGLHYVGVDEGDPRYPHVYTRNTIFPGFASCLFPCVDDGSTRYPFELSVRYPRTVGDALCRTPPSDAATNGASKADSVMSGSDENVGDLSEEEKAFEMRAVCSGLLTDTVSSSVPLYCGFVNLGRLLIAMTLRV